MVAHVLDRVYRQSNPFIENLYSMSNVTDLIYWKTITLINFVFNISCYILYREYHSLRETQKLIITAIHVLTKSCK